MDYGKPWGSMIFKPCLFTPVAFPAINKSSEPSLQNPTALTMSSGAEAEIIEWNHFVSLISAGDVCLYVFYFYHYVYIHIPSGNLT